MSQKVQHIPPSGHLSTASLALLMAGQSLTTQYLSGVDIRGLVLADIAASLLLVLVCGTRFLRIVSLLQGLLSLFCLSYAASMGMPPTLAAILNGSRQIAGMDLRSLWTYIDPAALVALSLLVAIQCWLCGRKPRYRHRWLAIIPACALLATQYNACLLQPPRHFTPEFILGEGRSRFEPPARRSLKYRGYLGTFLMELGSGTAFTPPYVPARTCSSAWTDQIPVPAAPSQLALVQVESLDFELLEMDVDGRPVMPFLRSLLPDAILLRLDGTKKLASANSDFELFNGLEASPDFVHYEYENAYPRSLIAQLGSGGRPVEVFHGLPANYMNLRAAYKLQGFSRYHDIEVMRAAGVRPLDCWWAGVVTDKDLFDYAAQQMPSGPFVQFIITMSMHLPEYVDRIAPERRFCSSSRSAFLTLAHDTDIALRHYVAKLPQGAMLILWGDHRSYSRDNSGLIPFLVYIKGASLHFDGRDLPVMSRCSMYFYLQRIFGKGADAPSCGGSHERERERESLTHLTNTSNVDNFSLIFYIYRKIPEPDPDRFYRLSSLVDYPFFYPFFARRLLFSQEYTVVIENKNFSEKFSFFSAAFLFVLRTELPLTMLPPAWSAGVFCIYGSVLFPPAPDDLPRIRAPPLNAPYPPGRRRKPLPALPLRLCVMPTFERSVNSPQEDFPLRK